MVAAAMWKLLASLICDDQLFTGLKLADQGYTIAKTTNPLEGGPNKAIKDFLRGSHAQSMFLSLQVRVVAKRRRCMGLRTAPKMATESRRAGADDHDDSIKKSCSDTLNPYTHSCR